MSACFACLHVFACLQRLALAFDNLDLSHSGIISSSQLLPLLRATGMIFCCSPHLFILMSSGMLEYQVEAKQFLDPPGQGGVILKMEFVHWAEQKKLSSSASSQPPRQHPNPISSLDPPKKFVLYHYNGQGAAGEGLGSALEWRKRVFQICNRSSADACFS